jgi:hypothetical protein
MAKKSPKQKEPESEQAHEPRSGRPTSYQPEYAAQAEKLCKLGATDADLAEFFGVNTSTIWRWTGRHEAFCNALKSGKEEADERVERSLYQKAIGYEYDAVKIFNANGEPLIVPYREKCAPDTTAAIFWLKNRRSDKWRDVHKHEHGGPGDFDQMSDDELREFISGRPAAKGESKESSSATRGSRKAREQLN